MEVNGKIFQKVIIDPIEVLQKLRNDEIGENNWVSMYENKFYVNTFISGGTHSCDYSTEIDEKTFYIVNAIDLLIEHLKTKNK